MCNNDNKSKFKFVYYVVAVFTVSFLLFQLLLDSSKENNNTAQTSLLTSISVNNLNELDTIDCFEMQYRMLSLDFASWVQNSNSITVNYRHTVNMYDTDYELVSKNYRYSESDHVEHWISIQPTSSFDCWHSTYNEEYYVNFDYDSNKSTGWLFYNLDDLTYEQQGFVNDYKADKTAYTDIENIINTITKNKNTIYDESGATLYGVMDVVDLPIAPSFGVPSHTSIYINLPNDDTVYAHVLYFYEDTDIDYEQYMYIIRCNSNVKLTYPSELFVNTPNAISKLGEVINSINR